MAGGSFLFEKRLLEELDFTETAVMKKHNLSSQHPGEGMVMRFLGEKDFDKGYLDLLSQLTSVGNVTEEMWTRRFNAMKSCANTYYIVVVEDVSVGKIICAASLIVELHLNAKLQTTKKGRIEDVVVSKAYRGKQLGQLIVETLVLLSKRVGCAETSLECKDHLIKFYARYGFELQDGLKYTTKRIVH